MKKKIFTSVGVLVVAVVAFFLLITKKEQIIITFDSNGGTSVSKMAIIEGENAMLPDVKRSGYGFLGWYDGDKLVDSNTIFTEDVKLVAKWEKIEE